LGYGKLIDLVGKNELDSELTDKEAEKESRKLGNRLSEQDKRIEKVAYVRSSHGLTLRPCIRLTFNLSGVKVNSRTNITDRGLLKYQMIIGKRDLKEFLVDVGKK